MKPNNRDYTNGLFRAWLAKALSQFPLVGIVLWLCMAVAQDRPAIRITPQAIFARYLQAIGGEAAVRQVHTAHIKAEMRYDALAPAWAWVDRFEDERGRFYEEGQDKFLSGWRQGFDGNRFWFVSLFQGRLWRTEDANAKRYLYGARYIGILRDLTSDHESIEVLGAAAVRTSRTVVLRVVSSDHSSVLYYFDAESGLLLRVDFPVRWKRYGSEGKELRASNDEDWGAVETCLLTKYEPEAQLHVLFPREITCRVGGTLSIYKITRIDANAHVDEKRFNEPQTQ